MEAFAALGEYAQAGERAYTLAMQEAVRSSESGRIPISGAAVQRQSSGELLTVCVGCNGRIPADGSAGYPTDHGETGAIRLIDDMSQWDWSQIVFATTLSPCIMCTRTLQHLHGLGLRRIVIAESQVLLPHAFRCLIARLPVSEFPRPQGSPQGFARYGYCGVVE